MGHTETTSSEKPVSKSGNTYTWNLLGTNYSFTANHSNLYSDSMKGSHSTRGNDQHIETGRDYTEDYGSYADGVYVENEKLYDECISYSDYSEHSDSDGDDGHSDSHSDHSEYSEHIETHFASRYNKHADSLPLDDVGSLIAKTSTAFPDGDKSSVTVLGIDTKLYTVRDAFQALVSNISTSYDGSNGSLAVKIIDRLIKSGDEAGENYHSEYTGAYSDTSSETTTGSMITNLSITPNPCGVSDTATVEVTLDNLPISVTYTCTNGQSGSLSNYGNGVWKTDLTFTETGVFEVSVTATTLVSSSTVSGSVTVNDVTTANIISTSLSCGTTFDENTLGYLTVETSGSLSGVYLSSDSPDVEDGYMQLESANTYEAGITFWTPGEYTLEITAFGTDATIDTATIDITVVDDPLIQ